MFNSISPLRYRWSFPAKFFFFLLMIATLAAPIPYVFFKPGVPDNVTGKLIEINDVKSYKANGKLYITSILVTNPDSPVFGAETLYNWAIGPHVVLPRDVVYPPAVEGNVIQRDSRAEMSGSKVTATAAALSYLGYSFEEIYFISQVRDYSDATEKLEPGDRILIVDGDTINEIEEIRSAYSDKKIGDVIEIKVEREINGETREFVEKVRLVSNQEPGADPGRPAIGILVGTTAKFPVDIDFNISGVGGPSAGLIFAVGVVEKMTPEDLLRGRKIAGTGSISPNGEVGAIGGIEEKMIGASRKGATIFLAPRDNCPDIKHIPKGLKVIPVSTLSEAIAALRAPDDFRFPTC
ncbi:MAG: PDZ domain-containing protein [Candidatus Nanopelagicaceae bacterium]|nr:PDZ domain-containing protein [Candidatus Nanopelagicaceae bacterium]